MNQFSLGLQWRLAVVFLAVSVMASGMVAAGYFAGVDLGLTPASAWGAGIAAGLLAGLLGSVIGFMITRSFKRRLWDAGDMANRIAAGDFGIRLPAGRTDEIGWLEEQLNAMASHLEHAVGELRQLAEQNRKLAEEAGRGAALEERAKLARDLHDTVNQQLFVLAMRAAAARRRLEKLGGEAAATLVPELATLEELSRQAHGEARQLILQLRPTTLEQQGLGPALAEYVTAVAAKEGWQVTDRIDRTVRLDGRPGENLFRVAQEALNNVAKHARAKTVALFLERSGGAVELVIRDDGQGFDQKAGVRPTAVGLIGMQERVEALGGTLRVKSSRGQGTEIAVQLPLGAEGGSGT
ncbi:MAG TPA: histidine kinase [Symbiobacteriaceae bacterium]|jgi:NarL family two-component system sensor histidine kinase LiaS|nr:histidine kinase [Symbiobacteriaceae bacterium]